MGTVTSPGWIISPVHAAGLGPTQYKIDCILFWADRSLVSFRTGPTCSKKILKYFSKNTFVIFSCIFSIHFGYYQFVFLYHKDTNSVLNYLVFVERKKKLFHAYDQVSQS